MTERLAMMKDRIESRDQAFALAQGPGPSGTGRQLDDRIRSAVAEMESAEQPLLINGRYWNSTQVRSRRSKMVGSGALAVLIVAAALWIIGKAFQASRGAETALQEHGTDSRSSERTDGRTATG